MKILLAVDESNFADEAAQFLARQFHPDETEVRIVHAVQPIAVSVPPQMAPGYFPELEDQLIAARQLVDAASHRLTQLGFSTSSSASEGDAEDVILEEAEKWHPDLIVVGSHRRKGLNRLLLGSVSEAVARHAPCSVEILRPAA